MRRTTAALVALLAAAPLGPGRAAAQEAPEPPRDDEAVKVHWARATLETLGLFAVGVGWYWMNTSLNAEDWELHWDWASWREKLTGFDVIRFDTNDFSINATHHPLQGMMSYQVARANGFGWKGALLFTFGTALSWEYLVEFKEYISVNDIIVNTATGLSVGEPLLQIARYLGHTRPGEGNKGVALLLSPFDALHGFGERSLFEERAWHRFRVYGGGGRGDFGGNDERAEALLGVDLELVTQPHHLRTGEQSAWTGVGARNRVAAEFSVGSSDTDDFVVAKRVHTRTSLFGRYDQRLDDAGRGWWRFLGAATAFTYDERRLPEEFDRIAAVEIGPNLEGGRRWRGLELNGELALYADFAMVQAHAFGPVPPFHPEWPYTSSLRAKGYYFGYGGMLLGRARVDAPLWHLDLAVRGHGYLSIDGMDRHEMGAGPEDPHDVMDERLYGRAAVGVRPWHPDVSLDLVANGAIRRGTWGDIDRRSYEGWLGVEMSLDF